jgi:N6-adenosine-specific RNA methylase IME4
VTSSFHKPVYTNEEKTVLDEAKRIYASRRADRRAHNAAVRARPVAVPRGRYSLIVMDPPWPRTERPKRDVGSNMELSYPIMSEDELRNFRSVIDPIAADDCWLFIWTTQRFLPLALELAAHYGFAYAFLQTWVKNGGPQVCNRPQFNSEFVVCSRRGSPLFIEFMDFPAARVAPRREHSRKPDIFYETWRRVVNGPAIDLFAREPRAGYYVWGNEATSAPSAADPAPPPTDPFA